MTPKTDAAKSAGKPLAEPPALPPQIAALVLSNTTASATEQIAKIERLELSPAQKPRRCYSCFQHRTKMDSARSPTWRSNTWRTRIPIKIPLLLDLARAESHPMRTEARELLAAYFRQDYGTNWTKWELAMNTWLAKNPD